jgi:Flp pilus assembly pilin Flp
LDSHKEIPVLFLLRRLWKCERAATRLEYLLIAALLGLAALQVGVQFSAPPVM